MSAGTVAVPLTFGKVSGISIRTRTIIRDAVQDFLISVFVPALIKFTIYLRTTLLCARNKMSSCFSINIAHTSGLTLAQSSL